MTQDPQDFLPQDFLPQDYEQPSNVSRFLKITPDGTKIRIIWPSITWRKDWHVVDWENTSVRTKEKKEDLWEKKAKHFWAFPVWDYKEGLIKVWEVEQRTIQDQIFKLYKDSDWGNPTQYDLKIWKEWTDLKTKYTVLPWNKWPLSKEIVDAMSTTDIDINQIFTGGDIFTTKDAKF